MKFGFFMDCPCILELITEVVCLCVIVIYR